MTPSEPPRGRPTDTDGTFTIYLQQYVFDPPGMRDSSADRDVPGLAGGYKRRMPDGSCDPLPFVDAPGGWL